MQTITMNALNHGMNVRYGMYWTCFWMDCGSRYEICQEKLRSIYYHFLIVSRWITGLTTIHPDTEQHHPHHTGTPEDAEQTQNTHTIPKSSETPHPSGTQATIRGEENKGRIVSSTHHQTTCILGYPSSHTPARHFSDENIRSKPCHWTEHVLPFIFTSFAFGICEFC